MPRPFTPLVLTPVLLAPLMLPPLMPLPAAVVIVLLRLRRGARRNDAENTQCRHGSRDYTYDRLLDSMMLALHSYQRIRFDYGRMLTSFRLFGPRKLA